MGLFNSFFFRIALTVLSHSVCAQQRPPSSNIYFQRMYFFYLCLCFQALDLHVMSHISLVKNIFRKLYPSLGGSVQWTGLQPSDWRCTVMDQKRGHLRQLPVFIRRLLWSPRPPRQPVESAVSHKSYSVLHCDQSDLTIIVKRLTHKDLPLDLGAVYSRRINDSKDKTFCASKRWKMHFKWPFIGWNLW